MAEEDVIENDGPIIPEEDFREAISACRQDPELDRLFKFAPPGARLFIGLGFYSTHFGEKTDTAQYKACLEEIEPSLTPNDLKYLIRFEQDKETKRYLRDLLAKREEEERAVPELPPEEFGGAVEQQDADVPKTSPEKSQVVPQAKKASRTSLVQSLRIVADAEPTATGQWVVPVAIGVGVVMLFICLFLVHSRMKIGQELARRNADVENLQRRMGELQQELERTRAELRKVRSAVVVQEQVAVPVHEERPAPERRQDVPTESVVEDKTAEEPSEAKPEIQPEKSDKTAKVVFTDGRKIVRKNNGRLIEVPRTFSYTGAGLKKPFWIYDRKLGEAKMEAEAKLEKQARATWRALYEEALRQEGK